MKECVSLLTQHFCLAGATSGHGLLESLMTTCWLQGQCSSPGLVKLLPQSTKALCYSTGHEISTNEFVRERRPAKDPQGTAGRHLCPHRDTQQLGHGAPQRLGEQRRHAKRRWGASRLKGSACPEIAECICSYICINRGTAPFPLDLPLKQVEENQRWVLTFSSVQWSSRREPRRGTGTRTHLPTDGMMHQELPGQSTLLFPFSASTAAPLGSSLVFPSRLLLPHKKKNKIKILL